MKQVKLTGKTKHGKDRIRQHGDIWDVVSMSMQTNKNRMALVSLGETTSLRLNDGSIVRWRDGRNIDKTNDKDFDWVFI